MLEQIFAQIPTALNALGMIVAGAAILAALTPTPKDDAILRAARRVLDVLALNIGNARNRPNGRG